MNWRGAISDVAALLLLLLLVGLSCWPILPLPNTGRATISEGDFTQEFFPTGLTVARMLHGGELPLWNPYSNAGQPLLADPQTAVFYPPNWPVFALLQDFGGASFAAFELLVPAHLLLAAVLMYLLARRFARSRPAAILASVTFTFSGFLLSYPLQQLPILRTAVWLPLELLLLDLALCERSLRWATGLGLVLAIAFLAGHPQTSLFQLYALLLYTLLAPTHKAASPSSSEGDAQAERLSSGRLPASVVKLGLFGWGVSLAAGLAAVQLIPTLEFVEHSRRASVSYGFAAGGFTPHELAADLLWPRLLGGLPPYIGLLPLGLVLLAVWRPTDRWTVPLALIGGLGVLGSLGGHTFFYPALYALAPGFGLFRDQERAIYLFVFAGALLAGMGLDKVVSYIAPLSRGSRRPTSLVATALLWVCVLAVVADLFSVSWWRDFEARDPNEVYRASQIVSVLRRYGLTYRTVDDGVINGNHGLVYGVSSTGPSFELRSERLETLKQQLPLGNLYPLLRVRFLVTRGPAPPGSRLRLEERYRDWNNRLYELPNAMPVGLLFPSATFASDAEALKLMASPEFDPRNTLILPPPRPPAPRAHRSGQRENPSRSGSREPTETSTAETVSLKPNAIRLHIQAKQPSFLLLTEVYYPGWKASLDGEPVPLVRADYAFMAVTIPAGTHEVTLRYEPASLQTGSAISLVALAAALITLFFRGAPGSRPPKERPDPRTSPP